MFRKFFGWDSKQECKRGEATVSTSSTEGEGVIHSPRQQREQLMIMKGTLFESLSFRLSEREDDYRLPTAYEDGGLCCADEQQVDKLRSVGKEMIKLIGRKILSGSFNLTKVSFPIRACYPKSALYNAVASVCTAPLFLNAAGQCNNSIQRFKLTISFILSSSYYLNLFLKPVNPILGETLQGYLIDGSLVYAQQISHHPPITYFLVVGPNKQYTYSGYYDFQVHPGLNSLTLENRGKRKIQFKNGQFIQATFLNTQFSSTFIGTTRVEESGILKIKDIKNQLECQVKMGKVKRKPTDYFKSSILQKGKIICNIFGTYCGYIEFDKIRYWDGRDHQSLHLELIKDSRLLPSDWSHRNDLKWLLLHQKEENMEEGQSLKESLEERQRDDAKLRKKYIQHIQEIAINRIHR